MEDEALVVHRVVKNTDASELESDGINIADDGDALAELDAILIADFFADDAGGALALESGQLFGWHFPVLADVEDHVSIDRKTSEEIPGFPPGALEPGPGGDFIDAGNRFDPR